MDEFSLIKRYFAEPNSKATITDESLILGIGDDCAILRPKEGQDIVFSIDTMVEGVHFPKNAPASQVAWRLLAAAVSDLAAMGAQPSCFTLALTLPELEPEWLNEFSHHLACAADRYKIVLAGGDTTKGPLTLSVQVQGFVNKDRALLRSGAKVGDCICVSGFLGDSRAGLEYINHTVLNDEQSYLLERFYRPTPRIATGLIINQFASACIDVSDGLLADLQHILDQSKVAARLEANSIPMSTALRQQAPESALQWALSGGEDFELCFTVPAQKWQALQLISKDQNLSMTKVGMIEVGTGIELLQDGQWQKVNATGYNHFSN